MTSDPNRDSSVEMQETRLALEHADASNAEIRARGQRVLAKVAGFLDTGKYQRVLAEDARVILGEVPRGHLPRVLLAEDNAEYGRAVGARIARTLNVEVTLVPSVVAAAEALGQAHYAVVLADIDLADGLGIEVIELARKASPDVQAIVMSGVVPDHLEDIRKALHAAAKYPKSVDMGVLVETVRRLLTSEVVSASTPPPPDVIRG